MAEALPIVDIALSIKLSDIPNGPPCMVCGDATEKLLLEHVVTGKMMKIRASNTPGYFCPKDREEYYSHVALVESLTRARQVLEATGDTISANNLLNSIRLEKKIVRQQERSRPFKIKN